MCSSTVCFLQAVAAGQHNNAQWEHVMPCTSHLVGLPKDYKHSTNVTMLSFSDIDNGEVVWAQLGKLQKRV